MVDGHQGRVGAALARGGAMQRHDCCLSILLALAGWHPSLPASDCEPSSKATTDPRAPVDESLPPEEYVRMGMPAHDREWSAGDMAKAEIVLSSLARKGHRQLPRYRSERSGQVFARLASAGNLNRFKNKALPLETRFPEALDYGQATSRIFKLYLSAFLKKEVTDRDLVELMAAVQLRPAVVMLDLGDELRPTIKKDDPKYQVRMEGWEKMRRGFAMVVASHLQTLTERQHYGAPALERLLDCMQETLPSIVPRLHPEARADTMLRLEKLEADPRMKDLQPGLKKLREEVKGALDKRRD